MDMLLTDEERSQVYEQWKQIEIDAGRGQRLWWKTYDDLITKKQSTKTLAKIREAVEGIINPYSDSTDTTPINGFKKEFEIFESAHQAILKAIETHNGGK